MSRVFYIHKRPYDETDNVPIILSCKAVFYGYDGHCTNEKYLKHCISLF